jgi:hypothetical protein
VLVILNVTDVRNLKYARAVSLVLCKDEVKLLFFSKKGIIQDLENSRNNIESGGHTGLDRTTRREGLRQKQEARPHYCIQDRRAGVIIYCIQFSRTKRTGRLMLD